MSNGLPLLVSLSGVAFPLSVLDSCLRRKIASLGSFVSATGTVELWIILALVWKVV